MKMEGDAEFYSTKSGTYVLTALSEEGRKWFDTWLKHSRWRQGYTVTFVELKNRAHDTIRSMMADGLDILNKEGQRLNPEMKDSYKTSAGLAEFTEAIQHGN